MKFTLIILLILFSEISRAGSFDMKTPEEFVGNVCSPGNVLFYGQTVHGGKEILICQLGTNLFYSFGKLGADAPELALKRDSSEVSFKEIETSKGMEENFIITNGRYQYTINHGEKYFLKVSTVEGKSLSSLDLDSTFIIDNIKVNFSQ